MRISILKKLGLEPATIDSYQILVSSIKTILEYSKTEDLYSLKDWDFMVLSNLKKATDDELKLLSLDLPKVCFPIEQCQISVQKIISPESRKRFAAYYTINEGVSFMAQIAEEYLKKYPHKQKVVLADPFLGSGRTLTITIEKIGIEKLYRVWGIEPLPLPALVAYSALLKAVKGRKDLIKVIVGDAFKEVPKATLFLHISPSDIILTNPPFTRWKNLEEIYRNYLLKTLECA